MKIKFGLPAVLTVWLFLCVIGLPVSAEARYVAFDGETVNINGAQLQVGTVNEKEIIIAEDLAGCGF
nr:hypothetical protein [Clostridia bacterium]